MNPIWQIKDRSMGNGKRVAADSNPQGVRSGSDSQAQHRGLARKHNDLLQLFMETTTEEDEHLTDSMLVDSTMNFVTAGRDTTAQALSWTYYLMHRSKASPEIIEKLCIETERVLGVGKLAYESTTQEKYAEALFHEALRLYPSVPKNIKTCVEDDVFPSGMPVHKGEVVGWSPGRWGAMSRSGGVMPRSITRSGGSQARSLHHPSL